MPFSPKDIDGLLRLGRRHQDVADFKACIGIDSLLFTTTLLYHNEYPIVVNKDMLRMAVKRVTDILYDDSYIEYLIRSNYGRDRGWSVIDNGEYMEFHKCDGGKK